jgi:methylase of polypeptide subunit release factors
MDLEDPRTFSLFLEIYGTLPRAGPGSTADTLRALSMVPHTDVRSVLDLGCGPGAQTLVLAEVLPEADILALDLNPPMVAAEVAEEADREIEAFRRFSDFYSYGFFITRPAGDG